MKHKHIPIIFSIDDNYAPFLAVAIESIVTNTKAPVRFFVLNTGLSDENIKKLTKYRNGRIEIHFINVAEQIAKIADKLCLRDYYTLTTYFRFFIPSIFDQYDRVVYLDADITVTGDIADLYYSNLNGNMAGVIMDEIVPPIPAFARYVETVVGVDCMRYFNAGILVLDLEKLRKYDLERRFFDLMHRVKFPVAQDQDYMNVLLKDQVEYLSVSWNKTPIDTGFVGVPALIHYKMEFRPWQFDRVMYEEIFWHYAKKTEFYDQILAIRAACNEEKQAMLKQSGERLLLLAESEIRSKGAIAV